MYVNGSLDYHTHSDWQGSARLATGTSGSLYWAAAYSPFGVVYDASGPGTVDASFTGQTRGIDATSSGGQYNFPMRDMNPIQGRWWTPDPAGAAAADLTNPQTWNRYAYVCAGTNRRKGEDERALPGKRVAPRPDLEFCAAVREDRREA